MTFAKRRKILPPTAQPPHKSGENKYIFASKAANRSVCAVLRITAASGRMEEDGARWQVGSATRNSPVMHCSSHHGAANVYAPYRQDLPAGEIESATGVFVPCCQLSHWQQRRLLASRLPAEPEVYLSFPSLAAKPAKPASAARPQASMSTPSLAARSANPRSAARPQASTSTPSLATRSANPRLATRSQASRSTPSLAARSATAGLAAGPWMGLTTDWRHNNSGSWC